MQTTEEILEEYSKKVTITCNENHAHSALAGCISGEKEHVIICQLCEKLINIKNRLKRIKDM